MGYQEFLRVGLRCVSASRAVYWWPGDPPDSQALELAWEDGAIVLFDTRSDWTLTVTDEAWRDPFEGTDTNSSSWDLGRWTKEPVVEGDSVVAMVGAVLRDFMPRFSDVGELNGFDLVFDTIVVRLESQGGDLTVKRVGRGVDDD